MRKTLLTLCFAVVILPAPAWARRENPLEGQPAVRHRVELRKGRFEIGPSVNMSLNRYVRNQFLVGARLEYHINDWFSLGADLGYGIGADSALTGELEKQYPAGTINNARGQSTTWDQLHNRMSDIQFGGDIRAIFTPIAGKLGLFSKLFVAYDTYIFAGFGIALLKNVGSDLGEFSGDDIKAATSGFRPGASIGVGFHLFFNRFVAIGVEMKDMMFMDNEFGGDMTRGQTDAERDVATPTASYLINGDDQKFGQHFFVGLNLTFYLPASTDISR